MSVMAARVHPAGDGGPVLSGCPFRDRQAVHVRTQQDGRPGSSRVQVRDDPTAADPGPGHETEVGQEAVHDRRGAVLLEAQLRMRMQIASDGDEVGLHGPYLGIHEVIGEAHHGYGPPWGQKTEERRIRESSRWRSMASWAASGSRAEMASTMARCDR